MKKFFVLLAAAGLLTTGVTRAETLSGEEKSPHYSSGEIVVTAGRFEEKKKELTSNVTVITRKEIEESPARDLSELLAEKSVGHIQKYPGTLTSVGIRGFRSETHGNDLKGKSLILLNGRRAGTGNLSKIMTENIERIEIIRGAAAVQYGSAAMGGVVNVITRKGEGTPSFFVEHKQGTYDYYETSAGMTGAIDGLDFSGSYTFAERGDYDTAEGQKYYNTAYRDKVNGSVNVGYEFAEGNRIGVIYSYFEVDRQGSPNRLAVNSLVDYVKLKNESVDVIYDGGVPGSSWNWMARYYNGEDFRYYPVSGFKQTVDQQGAQGQVTYKDDIVRVTGGVDWLKYNQLTSSAPEDADFENPAVFLLAKAGLLEEKLIISAGMRYDDYDVEIKNNEGSSASADNLTKNLGIAYHVTENVKLRANYGEGFRMPTPDELAADYSVDWGAWGSFTYLGNPDLKPESSRTYEGGVDVAAGGFSGSLTYFYTDFEDKIKSVYVFPDDYFTWENLGGAVISGIEGELSYVFPVSGAVCINPYASFTYLTEYRDNETDELLTYTPETNLAAGVRINDNKGLSGRFNLSYVGKTEITYPTPGTKGGFAVANMSLSKRFILDDKHGRGFTVKGSIDNLFDRNYEFVSGYPMPGRSFSLGLRVDI
ncbi:MAG: TonB-dependent receptor [Prosthecochloris sp.]|nr:TonB-dependent receptor [Prosthecochloris sp.]